ncbi:MAG: PilZ domain-containing protein [Bdellovibrio sp.]|nr:MAG: PilZ domain-containing protein [Bdellovibrio sp.]
MEISLKKWLDQLKRKIKNYHLNQEFPRSIQSIVTSNYIDRRHNSRTNVPLFGKLSPFPIVKFQDQVWKIENISIGGLCLVDEKEDIDIIVGSFLNLELKWHDVKGEVKARLVGTSLKRKHIQFISVPGNVMEKIRLLIKPGYLGKKFNKVKLSHKDIHAGIKELWLSPSGDHLKIFQEEKAIFNFQNDDIFIENKQGPYLLDSKKKKHLMPLSFINDMIVCISNFKEPSEAVINLLRNLDQVAMTLQKTEDK